MYFEFNSTSYYVTGKDDASIYDLKTGQIVNVPTKHIKELNRLSKGRDNVEDSSSYQYLKDLVSHNLGYFHSNILYQEGFRTGLPRNVSSFTNMKVRIFNLYLQIQDDCNLKCKFCRDDGLSNRMTGCKKYPNKVDSTTINLMEKALIEGSMLGCQTVHFIGGEPLLNFEILTRLIRKARILSYKDIYVYTNGYLITEEILSFFSNDVKLVLHLSDFDNKLLEIMNILLKYSTTYFFNICLHLNNISKKDELFDFAKRYLAKGYSSSYIFDNLDVLEYHDEIQNSLNSDNIMTNEFAFFNNMTHHPCLYGKITIFANGLIGVCPMMSDKTIGNIKNERLSDILIEKRQEPYWDRVLKNQKKCSECSLRFGCIECLAVEQYIHLNGEQNYLCALKK